MLPGNTPVPDRQQTNSTNTDAQSDTGHGSASPPAIALPKGGGAIRGIGEKFAANPVTGTGSMNVPIATSPGRSGFGPQLSLSYDSGAGNGSFGLGWNLSLPSIARKTDKGLPKYQDEDESDVFIISGAEDLVPVLVQNGAQQWVREVVPSRTVNHVTYKIERYRPRIEGLFARIERWTNQTDSKDSFWRSTSRDNITTWYGKTAESRIADPTDPTHIFSWLICESYDDKGNVIAYQYKGENSDEVDVSQAHERNRTLSPDVRKANRYLKHIRYGNHVPYFPSLLDNEPWPTVPLPNKWFFEVVFDYGEQDVAGPVPGLEVAKWKCRPDPFSSYRSCFEVRTYRLCQRVLTFHHFEGELSVGRDCLVRSTDFTYSYEKEPTDPKNPLHSILVSVSQSGYKRQPGGYLAKSLPPLEFEYTQADIDATVREIDPESLQNLPFGLDGANYQWVDLDGEGLSGILTEQAGGWFYKRNLSPINVVKENGQQHNEARFAPLEVVAEKPSLAALSSGRQQLLDLAGDGQLDLVALSGPTPGFYERTQDEHWETFRPFVSLPTIEWDNPNLKFVDLTGDGHADVLITEDDVFCWYPSLAEEGFGPAERVRQDWDEEKGPRLVFADAEHSIHLADLSGDGLTDLVRIRNGEVCYWPNLGYGRFGAKVTMDNSPWFDIPDVFDPHRIQLADIDGSGVTDIIYLGRGGVDLYFNQAGNSWSKPRLLNHFPQIDALSAVTVVDLLGNGTACLVWSSPLPGNALRSIRYVDLMGERKPHLLIRTVNNLGAETEISYAPSTKFYLQDKLAGNPWITKLPFPVHVVERVNSYDRISRNRFVTRYAYHHGFFDGFEREFRGFGMVEQWDTEMLAALTVAGELPVGDNISAASHVPPVHTKTWFHTGVYLDRDRVSNFFAGLLDAHDPGEYYREPAWREDDGEATKRLLRDTILPDSLLQPDDTRLPYSLTPEEEREACRALKGSMLRQEIYALDGSLKSEHPYTVAEQNFTLEILQGRGLNPHAVFFAHPQEAIAYHYERNCGDKNTAADPRVAHTLTLDVDRYGNVLRSASVVYGRRLPDLSIPNAGDRAEQTRLHITCSENRFTKPVIRADVWRTPLPSEARSFELTGLDLPPNGLRFTFDQVRNAVGVAAEIDYKVVPTAGMSQKRLIEHVRTRYRPDDLGAAQNDPLALLPLGSVEPLALPGESYRLAFTPGLVTGAYGARLTNAMLETEGRYVHSQGDSNWWIASGRMFYSPGTADPPPQELAHARAHFFLPHRYRDPFHTNAVRTETFVSYDDYDVLVQETRDALGNRVTAGERRIDPTQPLVKHGNDYRVLQPQLMMDPNRNRAAVAYDALGMVVGTAVMGKPEENPRRGDVLDGFDPDLTDAVIGAHVQTPLADPHAILFHATTRLVYDLFAYQRTKSKTNPQPVVVYTLVRETHDADLAPGQKTKVQHSFSYSDGFGREIQKKIQADPGPVPKRDPATGRVITISGQPDMTPNYISPRWVGSGWTVFNNKGKPVRQYEPFFSDTHAFEFDVRIGVSPVLFYDPVERVVATLHPNHTWEKVVFDAWRQETFDVSDTLLIADPKNDSDVGDFFNRLPSAEYLPSWHALRESNALGPQEQAAARKAAIHANTPVVAYFDSLGRAFLTVAHNRFKYSDTPLADPPIEEFHHTRVIFDIEGNQRAVIDAKDHVVTRYDYDMLGSRIHQASMDAGDRWMINDVAGKSLYAWDSRDHRFHSTYDALRRPTDVHLREGAGADMLVGRTVYGETQLNPEANNLRGKVVQLFDQAGIVTSDDYDFKGNLLHSQRQLAHAYSTTLVWSAAVPLDPQVYTSRTTYDALNRPVTLRAPDNSVIRPVYNEANLLERVDANLRGAQRNGQPVWTPFVTDIDYDAKGQRMLIDYGNGVRTTYTYDPLTFRLMQLLTRRNAIVFPDDCSQPPPANWPGCQVQNLHYTYDPAGNITHIRDDAQQTIYFRNRRVEPSADYIYDAIYRLIEATGREHLGQVGGAPILHSYNDAPRIGIPHRGDGDAMGSYTERYEYDEVGNILKMIHAASSGAWTRRYSYSTINNRLLGTSLPGDLPGTFSARYQYDAHGNMLRMPQLQIMQWDFNDQLQMTRRQAVNAEDEAGGERRGERTYYVYDASGQRVRKVTELATGQVKDERIYLGGFEIYHRHGANPLVRETLHIMDDRQRIALVETRTVGSEAGVPPQLIRFQFDNHLGSASLELDHQGQIISYEEYYPYGSTSYQAVRSQTETPKRYRYTGKERDEETGFTYHGGRYCAGWIGRWVSPDPAGLIDGLNLYRYARNAPTVYTDGSGQDPDPVNDEQTKKDDEALKAIGVTRQQVIDYADMSRGHFREKYGGSGIVGQLRFRLSFPSDKVEALPSALLYRVLPKKNSDQTVYIFPSGRVGTVASETVNRAREIQVPTGTGAVVATVGYAVTGEYDPKLQALGDNVEGVASGFAAAAQNRVPKSVGAGVPDARPKQSGAPVDNTPVAPQAPKTPAVSTGGTASSGHWTSRLGEAEKVTAARKTLHNNSDAVASGTTRFGNKRNTPTQWRRVRDLWDLLDPQLGTGSILSPTNRAYIAAGRSPVVDPDWVRHFSGDAPLIGQKIPMHHVGGGFLNVPLPKPRHDDAHMPGGTRYNPGGPGSSG